MVFHRGWRQYVGKLRLQCIAYFPGIRHVYIGGSKEDERRLRWQVLRVCSVGNLDQER